MSAQIGVVEQYFEAMREGPAGQEALLRLFADDAIYIEPFSGSSRTHQGIDAIRAYFEGAWSERPPDLELNVERIDLDANCVRSTWVCTSEAFGSPVRGHDVYEVQGGRITRLEITLEAPAA